jgi:hypothetical protein
MLQHATVDLKAKIEILSNLKRISKKVEDRAKHASACIRIQKKYYRTLSKIFFDKIGSVDFFFIGQAPYFYSTFSAGGFSSLY